MWKTFDVARMLADVGGKSASVNVSRRLSNHGDDVHPIAIDRWKQRKSMPGHRIADLLFLSREIGTPIDPYDYIVDADTIHPEAARPKRPIAMVKATRPAKKPVRKRVTEKRLRPASTSTG